MFEDEFSIGVVPRSVWEQKVGVAMDQGKVPEGDDVELALGRFALAQSVDFARRAPHQLLQFALLHRLLLFALFGLQRHKTESSVNRPKKTRCNHRQHGHRALNSVKTRQKRSLNPMTTLRLGKKVPLAELR